MGDSLYKSTALSAAALAGIACLGMAQPASAQMLGYNNGCPQEPGYTCLTNVQPMQDPAYYCAHVSLTGCPGPNSPPLPSSEVMEPACGPIVLGSMQQVSAIEISGSPNPPPPGQCYRYYTSNTAGGFWALPEGLSCMRGWTLCYPGNVAPRS